MFTIIGGDGKEYGPVPAEQVRRWLEAGRADLETQAQRAGEEAWRRLGDFPEFSANGTFQSAPPPLPAAEPEIEPADPKALAQLLISRAAPLNISGCLERSWELLKSNFWPLVGTTFLVLIVHALVSRLFDFLPWPRFSIGPQFVLGPDTFANSLLNAPFYGGLYYYYLKKIRGEPTGLADAFVGVTRFFVPLFLVGVVGTLITATGFMLLVLPGIYFSVAYVFAKLLVVDRQLPFWDAMEVSRRVIGAQWWRVLAVLLLGALIAGLGLVMLLVGALFTIPIYLGAVAYAYEDLCHPRTDQ